MSLKVTVSSKPGTEHFTETYRRKIYLLSTSKKLKNISLPTLLPRIFLSFTSTFYTSSSLKLRTPKFGQMEFKCSLYTIEKLDLNRSWWDTSTSTYTHVKASMDMLPVLDSKSHALPWRASISPTPNKFLWLPVFATSLSLLKTLLPFFLTVTWWLSSMNSATSCTTSALELSTVLRVVLEWNVTL